MEKRRERVRFWRNRFGPIFAAGIRNRRIEGMKYGRWRGHLDEVFVKTEGERPGFARQRSVVAGLSQAGSTPKTIAIALLASVTRWTLIDF